MTKNLVIYTVLADIFMFDIQQSLAPSKPYGKQAIPDISPV